MEDIIRKLEAAWRPRMSQEVQGRPASVFLPLVTDENGEAAILFEHRAKDLERQPDEVSLPGGGIEAGETPEEAVIRETCEELLVRPEQIRLFGAFDGLGSHRGIMTIHTFAGALEDYRGTFDPKEVAHTFTVPLSWFRTHPAEMYETTITTIPDETFPFDRIPGGRDYPWYQRRNVIFFYQYGTETIWGLTARVVHTFLEEQKDVLWSERNP